MSIYENVIVSQYKYTYLTGRDDLGISLEWFHFSYTIIWIYTYICTETYT